MKFDLFDAMKILQREFGDNCKMIIRMFDGLIEVQLSMTVNKIGYVSAINFSPEELLHFNEEYVMMRFQFAIDKLKELVESHD